MMGRSNIGYKGIGSDGREIAEYYSFNPGGFGCSRGCPDCWAHKMSGRQRCPECREFKVHLHPERLDWPSRARRPGVVLCQFTGDVADPERPVRQIVDVLGQALAAFHHNYVWLTRNSARFVESLSWLQDGDGRGLPDRWWLGTTIRNQGDADSELAAFLTTRGNLWLSVEPLEGPLSLERWLFGDDAWCDACDWWGREKQLDYDEAGYWRCPRCQENGDRLHTPRQAPPKGVVIGQNHYKGWAGTETLEHVRDLVGQCEMAGVPVYVKQIWVDGELTDNPARFPPELRLRNLPWPKP